MKKINKILIIVTLALSLILVTGCNPEQFNKLDKYKVNLDVDLNQKIELNGIYPNSGMSNSDFANGYTTHFYKELTGYNVKYNQILSTDTSGVITNILTTQEKYHFMKLEAGTYFSLVSKESFVDLTAVLQKFGKNILEVIPEEAWEAVTLNGKIYAIPEISFASMIGSTLVWNMDQLKEVGITEVPDTIGEIDEAFHKLQTHFGATNKSYHAFAMSGAESYMSQLASAFELTKDFYRNEKGEVASTIYHENYDDYMLWLNSLVLDGIISREWQSYSGSDLVNNFARGDLGCGYINYWSINNLCDQMAASSTLNYDSAQDAHNALGWVLEVKGDGSCGSVVQSRGKNNGGIGIGYYISIPIHMAEDAAYVIDWIDQRITTSAYEGFYLGKEGVHYNVVDSTDPDAIEVYLGGQTKLIVPTDKFKKEILSNSMYATGANQAVGKALWCVREKTYNAWPILFFDEEAILENQMNMCPYIKGWSEIDIDSRSWILTLEQKLINSTSQETVLNRINELRNSWPKKYWTEEVNANVQAWYKNK